MRAFGLVALLLLLRCSTFGSTEESSQPVDGSVPETDSGPSRDDQDGAAPDAQAEDAAADAGEAGDASDGAVFVDGGKPIVSWTSPNGATWSVTDAGTTINAGTYNHPVVFPAPQLTSASDTYTVNATIVSPPPGSSTTEFGILARVQANGASVLFGSSYGGQATPFLDSMPATDWGPPPILAAQKAPAYTYKSSTRYKMKLSVSAAVVSGKMWEAVVAEPATWQVTWTGPYATGKGAGFYTYMTNGARLEALSVTP